MTATCPNNPEHKRFLTTAHVMQEWVVDEKGEFVRVANECLDVTHRPTECNTWTCEVCGAEAKVRNA